MNERSALRDGKRRAYRYRPLVELLEARLVFASDFGDAPLPYKTLLAEGGAEHVAIGPTLGANRDTEADGVHSTGADGDDFAGRPNDEDGVTFGTIRAGALEAMAVVNVAGGLAKLDAWIDFNGDGAWGGPLEQIADRVAVVTGGNSITFDVPSWARNGTTYARFRLSTAGNSGVGGVAADGEIEDYIVTVIPPKKACACFKAHNIGITADYPVSVFAADVDDDGDTDVLSASTIDDRIAWYENDGEQHFTVHTITIAANGAWSVTAADIDGDGDTDVLSASLYDDKIAWYENDGNENFTDHTITTTADYAESVFATDLDGDGDIDVLSASGLDHKVAWYENDGEENFTAHTITNSAIGGPSVYATDVDGDGDIDVLSARYGANEIAWYENDGGQNFTTHIISASAGGAYSVFAADVDGDGDTDVLSANRADDEVAWYENDGGQNFTERTITNATNGAVSVFAADVDGDDDTDVVSASLYDNKIAWYENDGAENFVARIITTSAYGALSVLTADVDGDGDLDLVSASRANDTIAWYENLRSHSAGLSGSVAPDPTITPAPLPPAPLDGVGPGSTLVQLAQVVVVTTTDESPLPTADKVVARASAVKRRADLDWPSLLGDSLPHLFD